MNTFGVYKKRLYQIFLPAGLFTLLIIGGLTGYFWSSRTKSNYIHYMTSSTKAMENASQITMTVVSKAISDAIRSQDLNSWSQSVTQSDYYFTALQGINQLKTITTDSSLVDYDLAVTTLYGRSFEERQVHMVLTKTGSVDRNDYFMNHKKLDEETIGMIFSHFSTSTSPVVIPYYEDGSLQSLYYITKSALKPSQLLCIATIPREALAGPASGDFILYNNQEILAVSNNSPEFNTLAKSLFLLIQEEDYAANEGYLRFKSNYVFLSSTNSQAWGIAYLYDGFVVRAEQIVVFGAGILVLLVLFFYVILRLVELLYRPVREALTDSLPEDIAPGAPIDEFKILKMNNERIKDLSNELLKATLENSRLSLQRCYRQLLFSSHADGFSTLAKSLGKGPYCVALLETGHYRIDEMQQQNHFMLILGVILDFINQQGQGVCIDIDHCRIALILHNMDEAQVRHYLFTMLHYMEQQLDGETEESRIATSSCREGSESIHLCYQEAVKTLEYRHLYSKKKILAYKQIASVDSVTYSYPLPTENRLVSCALEGKEEALEIFDQLIRTNLMDKTLSAENTQSLVYAVIGTINRIFQELKTTPHEFLGHNVDFKHWYEAWSASVTISQIRRTLQDIIQSVNQRDDQIDEYLLQGMLSYIYENYADDIMLNDMADFFNISPKYCGILFKQLSNQNFKDFLNRYRIEKAKDKLAKQPGIKVAELSEMVGFNSSSSFIRVFRKYTGITPKAYVKQLAGGNELP